MATEDVAPRPNIAATNEYPDRVGTKPDNPYLASFHPYIAADTIMPELTVRAVVVGTLLGMVFGASSLYLVLKVGLTVSASIPVAVISITLFRLLSKFGARNATILENNIVQTAGSAGESIAFGVGVTMPAIMILGFDLELTRVLLVAMLGGLLGILMMIPLRRALIVQQHGFLKYPEGTACAEVLKAGASDESRAMASDTAKAEWARANEGDSAAAANTGAKTIFAGFGVGLIYTTVMKAFFGWKEYPTKVFGDPFHNASVSLESSPALLGVGYIIGPRIAAIMAAGGVLAYLVLIPMISFFGNFLGATIVPPGTTPIGEMGPDDIRNAYVLYIGAGAVAAGGIISLVRSLPTIWHGLKGGLADLRGGQARTVASPRTDQDLSMKFVLAGIIALVDHDLPAAALAGEQPRLAHDRRLRLFVRHRVVQTDGRDRLVFKPDLGDDGRNAAPDLFRLPHHRLDGADLLRHRALHRGYRLHRRLERRHDFAGLEDRLPRRRHAVAAADRDPHRRGRVRPRSRPNPPEPE